MKSPDRKKEILLLAVDFIKTVGYDSFSFHDLAAKLRIRTASIHYHFPRKDLLGIAVCDFLKTWLEQLYASIDRDGRNAREKLRLFAEPHRLSAATGRICPISSLQAEYNLLTAPIRRRLKRLGEIELSNLTKILDEGRSKGELRFAGNSAAQAALVLTALKGSVQYARACDPALFALTLDQLELSLAPP